jgi:hypothetical protein
LCMPYSRAAAFSAAVGCADCARLAAGQCLGCCAEHGGPSAGADEGRGPPGAGIAPAQGTGLPSVPALPAAAASGAEEPQLRQPGSAYPWPLTPAEGSLRAYAVWAFPGHPELRGVHTGGSLAWRGLEAYLPGGAYSAESGVRLRGFATPGAAVDGYLRESSRHGSPALILFRWQRVPALRPE